VFKDAPLSPKDLLTKVKSIGDDESTRVSDILNPDQRRKYQDDVRQTQSLQFQPPGFPPQPPSPPPLPTLGSAAALLVRRRKSLCLSTPERTKVTNTGLRLVRAGNSRHGLRRVHHRNHRLWTPGYHERRLPAGGQRVLHSRGPQATPSPSVIERLATANGAHSCVPSRFLRPQQQCFGAIGDGTMSV
jgi:hypothetical protein